jgi:tetratricopeptide (TPR) repeat protein
LEGTISEPTVEAKSLTKLEKSYQFRGSTYRVETKLEEVGNFLVCRWFKNDKLLSSRSLNLPRPFSFSEKKEELCSLQEAEFSQLSSLFDLSVKLTQIGDGHSHYSLGTIFLEKEFIEEAEEQFFLCLGKSPDFSQAHNSLGITQLKMGKIESAINSFQKAVELDSKFADFFNNLGVAYLEKKDYSKAKKNFLKALDINPSYQDVYLNLGFANLELSSHLSNIETEPCLREAKEFFQKAYQSASKKQEKIEREIHKAFTWEEISRLYMLLKSSLNEKSSSQVRSWCDYFNLRFRYDREMLDQKEVENYLRHLSSEVGSGKNYPDLRNALSVAYLYYCDYLLQLAKIEFLKARSFEKTKQKARFNQDIASTVQKELNQLFEYAN